MPAIETISIEEAEEALAAEDVGDEQLDELQAYYRDTAKRIWPLGTVLHCPRCGRTQTATVCELANHLAHGWLTCHGEIMHVGD